MDAQPQDTPNPNQISNVDASVPFRSVKEAVALFKDRLFIRDILSSPKHPSFAVGNETSETRDLMQTSDEPTNLYDEQETPDKPANPSDDKDISLSLDAPSCSLEPAIGPTEPPMYGPTLSLDKPRTENITPSPNNNPTNPSSEQIVGSVTDEPSYSSEITVDDPTDPQEMGSTSTPVVESQNPRNEKHGNIVHGNDLVMMLMVLKKLETELQETKTELKLLKERGTETEMALATLNMELQKNISEAAKAAPKAVINTNEGQNRNVLMAAKTIDSPTLAQILSISDYEAYFKKNKMKTNKSMKKKPIIPLVTDLFIWNKKKESPTHDAVHAPSPLFSKMYFT